MPYEDDYSDEEPSTFPPWANGSTQIDHIIPRKDIYGCACGTNSPANAAVVSDIHNNAMSNQMDHPGRIELLQLYTNYVAPRMAGSDAGGDPDSSAEEPDAGGCAAGGTGTFGMALLVLAILLPRRRT